MNPGKLVKTARFLNPPSEIRRPAIFFMSRFAFSEIRSLSFTL
jgi:hypothetical protein